ncbi:hypothetical protein BHE74_00001391 [Ensete ventricosum]|nr:hypothetical protein BHE74_00001391 [Ensete ventricosum]
MRRRLGARSNPSVGRFGRAPGSIKRTEPDKSGSVQLCRFLPHSRLRDPEPTLALLLSPSLTLSTIASAADVADRAFLYCRRTSLTAPVASFCYHSMCSSFHCAYCHGYGTVPVPIKCRYIGTDWRLLLELAILVQLIGGHLHDSLGERCRVVGFHREMFLHIGQDPPKLDMPVFDSKMAADPEPVDVQIDVF